MGSPIVKYLLINMLMDILSKVLLASFNENIYGDIRFCCMVGSSSPCSGILCDCGQVSVSQSLNRRKRITIANIRVVV